MLAESYVRKSQSPWGRPLPRLNDAAELKRVHDSLAGLPITSLTSSGTATILGVSDQLRAGYDILYLVCHGALIEREPRLWLEDEHGNADIVPGHEFVTRLRELRQRPRLV